MTKEEFEAPILAALGIKPMEVNKMTIVPPAPIAPAAKPDHETLVDEFVVLDQECQIMLQDVNNGRALYRCMPVEGAVSVEEFMGKLVANFNSFREHLLELIEKRNAKLQEAGIALRAKVIELTAQQKRGPDGKSTTLRYGPFEVTSKTTRSFDSNALFPEVQKLGMFDQLTDLHYVNSSTGETKQSVHQEWIVHYDSIKNWLREQNMEAILQFAYREEEGTPAVTGPKALAMLGEVDKNKKGKK